MSLLVVFCLAAALVVLVSKTGRAERRERGPRPEGVAFVGAVIAASFAGLFLGREALWAIDRPSGTALLLLTLGLYALSALRGAVRLPPFVADLFVLGAAATAIYLFRHPAVSGVRLPFSNEYVVLGQFAAPLTILFVWAISRMTAALNRTPQVTGGFLGIVALTFLLIHAFSERTTQGFPLVASAALAGAGLATVPVALGRPGFNLGWSAALAMGFLLAQIAVTGLFKNMAFAIMALLLLVFGLPLLDVSFFKLRAAKRGKDVKWEEKRLRLHEALMRRGLSPAKISLLYLAMTAGLCALGVLLVITARWYFVLRAAILFVILFGGAVFFFSIVRMLMGRAEGEEIPEDVEAFGVRISPVTMTDAMEKIEAMIRSKTPHHVVTSDANAILRAQEDAEYAGILQRAALITPDGYGVMWGARLLNLPIYERVTGVDMVTGICERAAKNGYRIFILGSEEGIASTAAQKLTERYPGLQVVGTHHGMILRDEEVKKRALQMVKEANVDVLFVAMGIPLQEKFIAQHMAELNVPVSLGVGGSFDVYSEKLKRAPEYIQRAGLEWLYRVWQEPWRWKRMGYVPRFMIFALKEWLGLTTITRDQRKKSQAS
ncbi:MAG TPA: WecB/TagA/CpsF family glycosyltransferase [Abditibacteriaceae bacterium]